MQTYTDRQIQIINASIEVIAEYGIQGFTTANLAAKVGISEAGLYRHFENKVEILRAILNHFLEKRKNLLIEVAKSEKGPVDKIESIFKQLMESFAAQPAVAAVIFSESIFQNEASLTKNILEIMDYTRDRIIEIVSAEGSMNSSGRIRRDIPSAHAIMIIMGTLRLLVQRWYLSKYSFNLQDEGNNLWKSLRQIITDPKIAIEDTDNWDRLSRMNESSRNIEKA